MKENTAEKSTTSKVKKTFKKSKGNNEHKNVNVETAKVDVVEQQIERPTYIAPELRPGNWEMITDALVYLDEEIKYIDKFAVIKNTGLKSYDNEPIGESSMEDKLVKSSVRYAAVVNAGKSTNVKNGDLVAINMQNAKVIDFDKNYAVVPHFAIYGRITMPTGPSVDESTRTNIFRRIIKGWRKWLGSRNVLKQK